MRDAHDSSLGRPALLAGALLVGVLSLTALASHRAVITTPPIKARAAVAPTTSRATEARSLREGRRLNVNRATADELRLLPGIGPKLALRIVEARTRIGGFAAVRELDAVPGIGPKKLAQLAALITVEASGQVGNSQPTDTVNAK
jgi:competence ComEA-like helix-hairpin-helix protein